MYASMMFGGGAPVRRNLVNVVLFLDPMTRTGFQMLYETAYVVNQEYPIRLGIVPVFQLGNRLSRKVGFAFCHVAKSSVKAAVNFLIEAEVMAGVDEEDPRTVPPTEHEYQAAFSQFTRFPWNQLHELYDSSSWESQTLRTAMETTRRLGLVASAVLVNGKVIGSSMQLVMMEVQQSLMEARDLIQARNIRQGDSIDIKQLLSKKYTVVPSFNGKIMAETPRGIGLIGKPLSRMLEIVDDLSNIEWTGPDRAKLFYILYSKDPKRIAVFKQFMNESHEVASEFAVNPPQRVVRSDKDILIVNGRVFEDIDVQLSDLHLLEIVAERNRINEDLSPDAYRVLSCLRYDWDKHAEYYADSRLWREKSPVIYISRNDAEMTWDLIVDPFSREFQRIAGLVHYVDRLGLVKVRLAAIPPISLPDAPATYYRNAIDSPRAVFTMLNDTTTYSSMPDMPQRWIVESMRAVVDLDNILLEELTPMTHKGIYVLTNLLSEGVCFTEESQPAEGAELAVLDDRDVRKWDTIVMMSNGYWQLATNPGVWKLELGGQRTKTIYEMDVTKLVVQSFARETTPVSVVTRPGMEGMKVYNLSVADTSNTTRVDVFSVASGHLYERLLKIMMLAVRRNSKFSAKFWIIKAFLSPQFKATLPVMSKKYNFSYQLVSYKWPWWLRAQTEKQRIIWGNKILFLDVLFPLELDRVIYIDSDQVVRTDLIELMRMHFGSAPYAFTPFCDSREETEPFRFWKKGYWKDHLGDLNYHISALFAIDLRRFRKLAAGDWLRMFYQQLSADPGSLANLDQDLPNYAQSRIPIFSLPQQWLWCETWCSEETLAQAKTIDLCNNPLTKKPKLFVAQTMIKEWPVLDEEARNVSAGPDNYQRFFFPNGTVF
jgi:UDP-glucose:glycoprotein glucosyltransferase